MRAKICRHARRLSKLDTPSSLKSSAHAILTRALAVIFRVMTQAWKALNALVLKISNALRRGFNLLSISQTNIATNYCGVTQGDEMSKEQVVNDGVQAIQSGVSGVYADQLGLAYDKGMSEAPQTPGGFTQEQMDQAIADALAADEVIDQEKLAEAQAQAQGQIDALNAALADMTGKYDVEHAAVEGFRGKIDELQGSLDKIKELLG
jgi:hypothetical protein